MTSNNSLKRVSILSGLSENELEQIKNVSVFQTFNINKRIVSEDETTTDMFFILEGKVAIKSFSENGYEVLYTELSDGACFGEFSAIDGSPRAANVIALTDVSVARIKASHFKTFVRNFPILGLSLCEYLVKLARDLSERIFELSTLSVRARLKLELLRLAGSNSTGADRVLIAPAPTHQELAARISTHREAVSRELAHLTAQNLIFCSRKLIEIHSITTLLQSFQNEKHEKAKA